MAILHLTAEDLRADSTSEWSQRDGAQVILSLSANDVPRAVSAVAEPGKSLRISFHYLDHEESLAREVGNDLTVLLGKHSGKVLGFIVRGRALWPENVKVRIVEGVEKELERTATKPNQRMNYQVIRNVVDSNKLAVLLAEAQSA